MNVLEFPTRHGLSDSGRLTDVGGELVEWFVNRRPGSVPPSGSYVAYLIIYTDSASVSKVRGKSEGGEWGGLEGPMTHSANPEEFTREFVPVVLSLFERDISEEDDGSTSEISAFLDRVYDFAKQRQEDDGIDVIFEYVNNLLVHEQFDACDRILAEVDIARIPPVLMVSFLTITTAAKAKLKTRDRFFRIVKRAVAAQRGEKATERLLDGLD